MTLDSLILLEDALEMNAKGFTKDEFVGCVKESFRPANAQAWDDALALIKTLGTRRKAMNFIDCELDKARNDFFPA